MGFTTFEGPIRAGTIKEGSGVNTGVVVLAQSTAVAYTQTGAFASGITLPAGAQILEINFDTTAAWNSGTSDALEIGTSGNPDAYGDVADLQATAGRLSVTMDADQAGACANIGTADVPVYLKVTSVGTAASAGAAKFTIRYAQKASDGSAAPASA